MRPRIAKKPQKKRSHEEINQSEILEKAEGDSTHASKDICLYLRSLRPFLQDASCLFDTYLLTASPVFQPADITKLSDKFIFLKQVSKQIHKKVYLYTD